MGAEYRVCAKEVSSLFALPTEGRKEPLRLKLALAFFSGYTLYAPSSFSAARPPVVVGLEIPPSLSPPFAKRESGDERRGGRKEEVVVERGGRIGAPGCQRDGGGKRKGSRKKRGEGKGGTRLRRKVEAEVVVAPVPGPFLPPCLLLLIS